LIEQARIEELKTIVYLLKLLPQLRAELRSALAESPGNLREFINGPISWGSFV